MIRLTQLAWHNLHNRARRGQIEIHPVTVLVGPNDAGKTTILNLPRLLVDGPTQGNWPAVGEAKYSFNVHGFWNMDDASFRNGGPFRVDRGRSEGTHLVSIDGNPQKVTAAAVQLGVLAGKAWGLSISEIVAMTGRFRMDWLQANVLRGDWPIEAVETDIEGAGVDLVWLNGVAPTDGSAGQDYTKRAIHVLEDLDKKNEADVRQLRGAIEKVPAPPEDLPGGTVAEWRSKLEALTAEGHDLNRRAGEHQGTRTARETLQKAVAAAEARLAAIPSDEALRAKQVRAEADLVRAREAEKAQLVKTKVISARYDELGRNLQALENEHKPLAVEAEAIETRIRAAKDRAAAVTALPDVFEAIETLLAALTGRGVVREWDALDQAVKSARAGVQSEDSRTVADLRARMAGSHKQVTQTSSELSTTGRLLEGAHTEGIAIARKTRAIQEGFDALVLEREENGKRRERTLGELHDLREQIEAVSDDDASALDDALAAARERHKEITKTIDVLNDAASDAARAAELQFNLSTAMAHRGQIRDALLALRDVRARWAAREMAELIAPASALTTAVLGLGLVFRPDDDAKLSLVTENGAVIDLDTASHSQRTVAYVALYVACVERLNGWKVVLLDDLEHLEGPRRTDLLLHLAGLVKSGAIDQVIGACVKDAWEAPSSVHVVALRR